MINILRLKTGKEYYIVNEDGLGSPAIIQFKVIHELRNKRNRSNGFVEVQFLKYVYMYDSELMETNDKVTYNGAKENEIITEKIYKKDENLLFKIDELDMAKQTLEEKIDDYEYDGSCFEMDNYIPPEEYPDWDGDESIMYLIDEYNRNGGDCMEDDEIEYEEEDE